MDSKRQKRVCILLQKEISNIFQKAIRFSNSSNKLVSVTKVKISPDLTIAKVYVSIYPSENTDDWIRGLRENSSQVKHALSQKLKNELRVIPNLTFYLDDSLDYIEKIESSLKELQTKMQNYSADAENQTDLTNQKRQQELQGMEQNIQQFRQTALQDVQKKPSDLLRP